jgi:precorrin-2 dehydrogenase / sirohydrochlorin ferrochelatase
LEVAGKACLVTGEGFEIASKVRTLVDLGALVTYVNPTAAPEIQAMAETELVTWKAREYQQQDLEGCFLVITSGSQNAEVFRQAEERNVLCNAVDDPVHCRYSYGSTHRQGDLTIAISTNGIAPALAVRIRERLQNEVREEYKHLLDLLREFRPQITARISSFDERRKLWYRIVDSSALQLLRIGHMEEARSLIQNLIDEAAPC